MNIPEDVKAILNLLKLTFYLYLIIHVIGCSWYIVTYANKDKVDADGRSLQWYPPLEWINYTDSEFFSEEKTTFEKLLQSLYVAVLMLGNNEIGPVNDSEFIMCICVLTFLSLANAQIFGEMAVLISTIMKRSSAQQERFDQANSAMNKIGVPSSLHTDI